MINLRTVTEMDTIGQAGTIIGELLMALPERVVPGVSTGAIDHFAEEFIASHAGATAAFKGLYGFPGSVCVSVNEEVVHGIPSHQRILDEGDIVSIDIGVRLDGWCADSAWTYTVGEVSDEARSLMDVTERALAVALDAAVPGNHVGDIGAAVMRTVQGTDYGIIRELVGHGVGRDVHEEPQVPNVGRAGHGPLLRAGMVLAIEPMLSAGSPSIRTLDDGWTVVTADRKLSAHFEHTVGITETGPKILTSITGPVGARSSAPGTA